MSINLSNLPNVVTYNIIYPPNLQPSVNLSDFTNEELIHGKDPHSSSPLLTAIQEINLPEFEAIIERTGADCLRQRIGSDQTTPLQKMLLTMNSAWISKAVELFGNEVLMQPIWLSNGEVLQDFDRHSVIPHGLFMPFLHYFCRNSRKDISGGNRSKILSLTTISMLKTEMIDGAYRGLTPVHIAFLIGNFSLISLLTTSSQWSELNQPAGKGDWEGYFPGQIYFQNYICARKPKAIPVNLPHNLIFDTGPVRCGEREGFHQVHLALLSSNPYHGLQQALQRLPPDCLTTPIAHGRNAGTSALSLAQKSNDPQLKRYIFGRIAINEPAEHHLTLNTPFIAFGNLIDYTNEELIYGKDLKKNSPLLSAIRTESLEILNSIIARLGIECLRLKIPQSNGEEFTPLEMMLQASNPSLVSLTIQLLGPEVLMEKVLVSNRIRKTFQTELQQIDSDPTIPFLHHICRCPKTQTHIKLIKAILSVATVEMLTTSIAENPYRGLTAVHMAFLVGNTKLMNAFMSSPNWQQYNVPARFGVWEGYLPAHVYIQGCLSESRNANQDIEQAHWPKILESGPVLSGPYEGYKPIHLVFNGKIPFHGLWILIKPETSYLLFERITEGKNAGVTPLTLASQRNDPQVDAYIRKYQPLYKPLNQVHEEPIPNPITINGSQWLAKKLAVLRKNPTSIVDAFKENGLFDYSVYGDTFLHIDGYRGIFPRWTQTHILETFSKFSFPEGLLDDVAGAAFHLHTALIQQHIEKKHSELEDAHEVPFIVYTQENHEVRAHVAMGSISNSNMLFYGLDPRFTGKAIEIVKSLLGDSPYRFEEGQLVTNLEGFEKLTQAMSKPGLNVLILPRRPDPEPQEEQPRRYEQVRVPRPPIEQALPGTDEPVSMKRKPKTDANPPKRVRLTQSAPAPEGVDRRTALTDGTKTTHNDAEERISPPSKRQKAGKLETVPMGKTLEMPGIAIDEEDPVFGLKSIMKGFLESTLNNLKSASARSALIKQEPLPMPVAEKLSIVTPVHSLHPLTELKGYQLNALKQIMALSQQGVMPLLSLEMGLGKTYVFREWLLQRIIAYRGGRHLIIVPASVKEQTQKVFQDCLRELVQDIREINRGNARNDTGFTSEQLSSILRFPPASVVTPDKKGMKEALEKDHAILIVNYEILSSLKDCAGFDQLTSIVADEAQRVHNDQSQTQNHLAELCRSQRLTDRFRLLQVTATPYENDLTELWTLLSSSNPGLVPEESQRALTAGIQKIKENLMDSLQGKAIDQELLVKMYAHYKAFQQVLNRLVIYKRTTDPEVRKDWNGRIPTRIDEKPEMDLEPEVLEALSKATQELIETKNQLAFNAQSNAALIHTSLIGQSVSDAHPSVKQLYQNAEQTDMQSLIQKSAFLKILFGGENPILQRCYESNMKALVFVDHIVTGKLIQLGAKKIYGKEVKFFNGQCTQAEKGDLANWFENTNQPRVLVLTPKAGGVGLNLPSARLVVDLSQEYNIAQHYQAVARAIRANNEGEVRVLTPFFKGSFYQAHVSAHQAKKARWMEFFFGEGSFNQFINALLNETKIDLLNSKKNLALVNEAEEKIELTLALATTKITPDELGEAIKLVAHKLSSPAPITLVPREYLQVPLPYGTPRDDAIRLGKALLHSNGNPLVPPFIGILFTTQMQRVTAEQIRTADPHAEESNESRCLRRALRVIDERKNRLPDEPLFGKDFIHRTDQKTPCYVAANEDQMDDGVYLYKKPLPNGQFHYEPLIDFKKITQ